MKQRDIPVALIGNLPIISLGETAAELLIGTYKGLFILDRATGVVTHYQHDAADPQSLPNNEVINIVVLRDGDVLLATPAGMGRMKLGTRRFVTYANNVRDPDSLPRGLCRIDHPGWR